MWYVGTRNIKFHASNLLVRITVCIIGLRLKHQCLRWGSRKDLNHFRDNCIFFCFVYIRSSSKRVRVLFYCIPVTMTAILFQNCVVGIHRNTIVRIDGWVFPASCWKLVLSSASIVANRRYDMFCLLLLSSIIDHRSSWRSKFLVSLLVFFLPSVSILIVVEGYTMNKKSLNCGTDDKLSRQLVPI